MTAKTSKREKAKAKAEQAQQRLAEAVENITDSDAWQEYLATAARFHQYSFGNVLLIMSQRPDATQVAGFRKWQELGRQVRKGETGITILAPRTGPCYGCTEKGEKRGRGCDRCSGRGRYLYFTTATVFDVAQTDGDPLPANPVSAELLTGGDDTGLFERLAELLLPDGWTLSVGDAGGGGVNGYCDHGAHRIVVEQDRDPAHQVKTLVHELAHASLHAPSDPDRPGDRGAVEVEAESVAFVVLGALGIDTSDWSVGYVAGWQGNSEAVKATAGRVLKEAHRMLDVVAEHVADDIAEVA